MPRPPPSNASHHQRQVLLFLAAIVLLSAVLVALTLRTLGQERELVEQRAAEERRRLARQLGLELVNRLERRGPRGADHRHRGAELSFLALVRRVQLWRVSAQGGEPRPLDFAMPNLVHLRVHPDGRRIAFTARAQEEQREVWVLENFIPRERAR